MLHPQRPKRLCDTGMAIHSNLPYLWYLIQVKFSALLLYISLFKHNMTYFLMYGL